MITVIYLYALYIKEINRAIYSITFSLHENPSRINGDPSLHCFLGLFLLIFFSLSLSLDANKQHLHDKYSRRVATENVSSTVVRAIDNFDNGHAVRASCRFSLLASLGDLSRSNRSVLLARLTRRKSFDCQRSISSSPSRSPICD